MKKIEPEAETPKKRGPARVWDENMVARFKAGTLSRIDALLKEGQSRVQFVHDAVMKEIERQEKKR